MMVDSPERRATFHELKMNYSKYNRPISNPIKIIVTDKMKRTIKETDKYWNRIELKLKRNIQMNV